MKRKPWRRSLGTSDERFAFKLGVLAADGVTCVMHGVSRCEGELQAAHVIPKRKLRVLGFGSEVIYSADAAMTLCQRHHNRHDWALEHVPYELVPKRCQEFVIAFGLSTLLERTYGQLDRPDS